MPGRYRSVTGERRCRIRRGFESEREEERCITGERAKEGEDSAGPWWDELPCQSDIRSRAECSRGGRRLVWARIRECPFGIGVMTCWTTIGGFAHSAFGVRSWLGALGGNHALLFLGPFVPALILQSHSFVWTLVTAPNSNEILATHSREQTDIFDSGVLDSFSGFRSEIEWRHFFVARGKEAL